jgi:glycine/D-amino acid oxidase-like deaminating enzyme
MFDFIVIGKGLIGSAAFRYLSEVTRDVAIIGPDEPSDYRTHLGVFASHYDEGRLVSRFGKDDTWARLVMNSVAQYPLLEERSGIAFYAPCGRLTVVPGANPMRRFAEHAEVTRALEIAHAPLSRQAIAKRFPMFAFPYGMSGIYEPAPAGMIRPRKLIRSHLAVGSQNGATIVCDQVRRVRVRGTAVAITTAGGEELWARRILIACGAFSNCYDLLDRKLALRVKSETVLLVTVTDSEVERLRDMPTLGYSIDSALLSGIYMTPPLRYPDGRFYLKLGCNTASDEFLPDLVSMQQWMRAGRADGMAEVMLEALQSFMPGLRVQAWQRHPCLVTYTEHGKPYVDQVSDEVFIATGGCGSSAQCSDTLGLLASCLLLDRPWPAPFARETFRAMYERA